ncbi:probable LRR receptor-like serine/threonine-protein kinase At1g53430 [Pistacia vera]|uniref:probable LRR receptor-like serine/threonine-protein kinase At1g53430 n=1 Tax=Pistacia vera TaxID=55513 RepID=UPI001263DE69|nr:probable LRR receptor-like serine/threonine-protein kinase At1g53430 [Pistacia vera]
MERGSLEQVLFDSKSEVQLDWQTRVKICLGVAKGLQCIHEDGYLHRNVKASNILLDENLNAKVSDLGLAKLYNEEDPFWFLKEIGTRVNTAPESATGQADTNKADVYSYGILLLEIVSGKSNSKHEQNQETTFLLNTARICHKRKRLLDLVDPKLPNNCRKQALEILDLAMECISDSHDLRPTMSNVVNKLTETENPVKEMIQKGDSVTIEG